jgi:hypothetical protein
MPIAALAIAALVAVAVARRPGPLIAAILLVAIFLDLRLSVYGAATADEGNRAYAALARSSPGRVLELPVFPAERHWNSVYLYYGIQAPRERMGGYSTTAPPRAAGRLRVLMLVNCGLGAIPDGVRYVVVHRGLYRASPLVMPSCRRFAERALRRHGWRRVARDGLVTLYAARR